MKNASVKRHPGEKSDTLLHRSAFKISAKFRQTFSHLKFTVLFIIYFFRAQAFEEALRKDLGCSAEKGTTKKGENGGLFSTSC